MKTLFKNFILLFVAIISAIILFPIGWFYSLFTFNLKIHKLSHYFITLAISVDQMGNVILAPLFNKIMIMKDGYNFGDEDDTISYVLGANKIQKKLTKTGNILANLLDYIDENHCIKTYLNSDKLLNNLK